MEKYHTYLTNCLFIGEERQEMPDGRSALTLVKIRIGGFTFRMAEAVNVLESRANWQALDGRSIVTTRVELESVDKLDPATAESLLAGLADLLSFATTSEIQIHDGPDEWNYQSFNGPSRLCLNEGWGPLDSPFGSDLKRFVEQTWSNYWLHRSARKLNTAVAYCSRGFRKNDPIELNLIVVFVLLEHLKTTWAVQNSFPFNGRFEYPVGHRKAGAEAGFEALLKEMLCSVGMTGALHPIVKLRNEIIHSGLSSLSAADQWAIWEDAQTIIREYCFRLLGYKGRITKVGRRLSQVIEIS